MTVRIADLAKRRKKNSSNINGEDKYHSLRQRRGLVDVRAANMAAILRLLKIIIYQLV